MATTKSKSLINLLRGWPAPSLLPADAIKSAAITALSDPSIFIPGLQYGLDWGYVPLHDHLSTWLRKFYPQAVTTGDHLCITGGASQNLTTILLGFTDPAFTRHIWMVSPTYFMACPIFHDAGFTNKLRSVAEDPEGIDIPYLRDALAKSEKEARNKPGTDQPQYKKARPGINKHYKHIIYCVPTFANPSAKTMSLRRRIQLVEVAREYDALVVTDDVYDFLQWRSDASYTSDSVSAQHLYPQTAPQPRLVDIDAQLSGGFDRPGADGFGNTVSNASFSKIAGPGVRCGWAEGSPKLAYGLSQTGAQKSGGAPSQMTSTFMTDMLQKGHLQKHIREQLQPAYAKRWASVMRMVDTHLKPLGVEIVPTSPDLAANPDDSSDELILTPTSSTPSLPPPFDALLNTTPHLAGGYFIYLRLPPGLSAQSLATHCKAHENLIIGAGPLFHVAGDEQPVDLSRDLRLSFAWETEENLEEGVGRIARALGEVIKGGDVEGRGEEQHVGEWK